jgi:hypothetical protein
MKRSSSFKQTDVSRAVKGVVASGIPVEMVEVGPDEAIRVFAKLNGDRVTIADDDVIESALRDLENGTNKNPVLRRA